MAKAEKIIAEQSETVGIDTLVPYAKNPRKGDVEAIAESLKTNGQFKPIVVRKGTNEILGGNHTWKAAKTLGWKNISVVFVDVDDTAAKRIVLSDNRTNDLATYDTNLLTEILKGLPTPVGTGYDDQAVRELFAGIQDRDAELIQNVVRPPATKIEFEPGDEDDTEWDLSTTIKELEERRDQRDTSDVIPLLGGTVPDADMAEKLRVAENIASIQEKIDDMAEKIFSSSNYWGIPDLRRDMLLDELPDPLDTWGGADATPDDGVTTWIWNTGVASSKDLPWDRAILSFFTYDFKFESWFKEPGFNIAKVIHNGLTKAIVPDTSFWIEETRAHHMQAQYQAQFLGRLMQEAGIKVIPRFMWCDLESIKVGTLGVPRKPPIAAVCIQAMNEKEAEAALTPEGLRAFVKEIQPEALIVYGGNPAKRIVDKAVLPKSLHVVHVDNFAAKRRGVVFDAPTGKKLVDQAARKRLKEERLSTKDAVDQIAESEDG